MSLQERVSQEIKAAMLAKAADRLSALRMLKSAMGYAQIERKTESLPDADVVAIVQKEVKKRRDASAELGCISCRAPTTWPQTIGRRQPEAPADHDRSPEPEPQRTAARKRRMIIYARRAITITSYPAISANR